MPIQTAVALMEEAPFLQQRMDDHVALESARAQERLRIAQDLHDTCIQGFLAVTMHLRAVAFESSGNSVLQSRIEMLAQMAADAVEEGRRSVDSLRSPARFLQPLDTALARIPLDLALDPSIRLAVSVLGEPRELHIDTLHEVYWIGREAILNAFWHSGADEIHVKIQYESAGLRLCIGDNGCGFDSTEGGRPGHWGLPGLRERAKRIGARLQFRTSPASGTQLALFVSQL